VKKVFVSIVIPVKELNDFLRKETIPALLKQSYQDFEIIIITDKPSKESASWRAKTKIMASWPKTGPADKRDMGVEKAKGEIIAFLDDDSYPDKDWLKKALKNFKKDEKIAGVAGPNITPPHNSLRQKASGYVWSTWLGSGGAGTYRCAVSQRREVDDFPTVNLLVRKKDFLSVGGFDSHYWPGEDTKLCHDLVYKLGKKIIYTPEVLVYHHRREVFKPHLQQISRYAIHRGHFARILPKTSLRPGYLVPTFFVLWLFGGPLLIFLLKWLGIYELAADLFLFYLLSLAIYLLLLFVTVIQVYFERSEKQGSRHRRGSYLKEKNLKLALLVIPSIFITHIVYGVLFIKGFFLKKLQR